MASAAGRAAASSCPFGHKQKLTTTSDVSPRTRTGTVAANQYSMPFVSRSVAAHPGRPETLASSLAASLWSSGGKAWPMLLSVQVPQADVRRAAVRTAGRATRQHCNTAPCRCYQTVRTRRARARPARLILTQSGAIAAAPPAWLAAAARHKRAHRLTQPPTQGRLRPAAANWPASAKA